MMTLSPSSPRKRVIVLQVIPALDDGGAQKSGVEMALYLHDHPHDVDGIEWMPMLASAGGPMERLLEEKGVEHIRLPLASRWPWMIFWNAVRLGILIRRRGIGVVHARSRAPAWSAWLGCFLARVLPGRERLQPVAFLSTFHGLYGTRGWGKLAYNRVMLKGDVTIANSEFIKTHIMKVYGTPADQLIVAPRGIEPADFDPAAVTPAQRAALRAEAGVADGVPLLLLVGRLTRWKGQDVFLRALAEVKDLPWQAVLVGGPDKRGTFAAELKALVEELGLEGRVYFAGSRSDVPLWNATADLALSCSTEAEAFGRVAVEAQAMGTPVIATAHGGSLETVMDGETGWLVPPGEPHPLAEKLRLALTNPSLLPTMGKNARAWVISRFTVDACCRAELSAYVRLLTPRT